MTNIIHERFLPFHNKFKYFVPSLLLDNKELKFLNNNFLFFSVNSFNLFSFYEKDHGFRDKRSLKEFVEINLKKNKIDFFNLDIKILCFPRILGYVFNPLSIIYCYESNKLIAIFYEVKNTSNEQHTYLFKIFNCKNNYKQFNHKCSKRFYVSPFIDMEGVYEFTNKLDDTSISININLVNKKNRKKIMTASQYGYSEQFSNLTLMRYLYFNPLIGFKVFIAIIYEAVKIFFKGGKYYSRRKKPNDTISYEGEI